MSLPFYTLGHKTVKLCHWLSAHADYNEAMGAKTLIWIGVFVGSLVGGGLGALVSHGNWMSWQSLLGGTLGAFGGIYAALSHR